MSSNKITDVARHTLTFLAHLKVDRARRNEHFALLKKIQQEYRSLPQHGLSTFSDYVLTHYGVVIVYNNEGYVTGDYSVADEKKYLLCKIKFSQ